MDKLTLACEMSLDKWLDTFPEEIPEPECSKKHEKWKKKLFDRMRGDRYHKFTTKAVKVMLVAAVLCALLLTAFVIPSSREFMLDKFDEYSTYKLTENNKNSVSGEITVGYVPEGFELSNNVNLDKQVTKTYLNLDGTFFTIFKHASSIKVDFDTETYVVEEISHKNIQYLYCNGNDGINSIIWNKNDYIYQIEAPFEKEELLKIAKTVE